MNHNKSYGMSLAKAPNPAGKIILSTLSDKCKITASPLVLTVLSELRSDQNLLARYKKVPQTILKEEEERPLLIQQCFRFAANISMVKTKETRFSFNGNHE